MSPCSWGTTSTGICQVITQYGGKRVVLVEACISDQPAVSPFAQFDPVFPYGSTILVGFRKSGIDVNKIHRCGKTLGNKAACKKQCGGYSKNEVTFS